MNKYLYLIPILFILIAAGLYLSLSSVWTVDPRVLKRLRRKIREDKARTDPFTKVSSKISSKVLWPEKILSPLREKLERAHIPESAELYLTKTFLVSLSLLILSASLFWISWILVVFFIFISFLHPILRLTRPQKLFRQRITGMEEDLSWVVFTVRRSFEHNRDVIGALEKALQGTGPEMRNELLITIAEMKSGHPESALLAFEQRCPSELLTGLVRGLLSALAGDDTKGYFLMLSDKISEHEKLKLSEKASKVPKKVRKLSLGCLILFLLSYAAVMTQVLSGALGGLFS